jgi:hypothetical protein
VQFTRALIAEAAHEWLESNLDAGCEGHPPHPHLPLPFCEELADAILAALRPARTYTVGGF